MRLLLLLALLVPAAAISQEAAKKGPPPEPKNLKVLQGMPREQLIATMRSFTAALSVKCDHCHVQGDFASDANPKKDVARDMIVMAHEINKHFPGSEPGHFRVTCYTCHRGALDPPSAAPPASPAPAK